jgi:hypothetical protein
MSALKPVFDLTIGSFRAKSEQAAGGPVEFVVQRDMDVAADALEITLMQAPDVSVGDPVTLKLGHDDSSETVFTGELVETRLSLQGARLLSLGNMNKLLNNRRSSFWEGQSAGSIVEDVLSAAGCEKGEVSSGPTLPFYARDRRVTGWQTLRKLADVLGYELFTTREGKVMFQAFGSAASLDSSAGGLLGQAAGAAASLLGGGGGEGYAFGKHVIKLSAVAGKPPLSALEVGGESPMSSEGDSTAAYLTANDTDYRGTAGDGTPEALYLDFSARTKDLADRFAGGLLATARRRTRKITVTILGRPSLELGDDVQVSDMPESRANGRGYVRALRHTFGGGGGFVTAVRVALEVES